MGESAPPCFCFCSCSAASPLPPNASRHARFTCVSGRGVRGCSPGLISARLLEGNDQLPDFPCRGRTAAGPIGGLVGVFWGDGGMGRDHGMLCPPQPPPPFQRPGGVIRGVWLGRAAAGRLDTRGLTRLDQGLIRAWCCWRCLFCSGREELVRWGLACCERLPRRTRQKLF